MREIQFREAIAEAIQQEMEQDSSIFLMGEEGILTNQILSVSGNILYLPDLIVYHLDHSSINKLTSRNLYRYSKISYKHYLKNLKYIN